MTTYYQPPPPESYSPLVYALFQWKHSLKKDWLARQWFNSSCTIASFDQHLGGYPLTLYESALPGKAAELFLDNQQCAALKAGLAQSMGPTRAGQSWKAETVHSWRKLDSSTGGQGIKPRLFYSRDELEARMSELRRAADAGATLSWRHELATLRQLWRAVPSERPNYVALDVETWEMDHDQLTEFGWSVRTLDAISDTHVVVEENLHRRNGRYCADGKDNFDFGQSIVCSQEQLHQTLSALLGALSATLPLFLILHAPTADLEALQLLGISVDNFISDFSSPTFTAEAGQVYVVDTQKLFMGWSGERRQTKLFDCASQTGVQTAGIRPHNAGNDAVLTRLAFEMMMNRDRA